MTNTSYSGFCLIWLSIGSCAVHDHNRVIERTGHAATIAHLAAQQDCDCTICHYARRHPQLGARRCWE